MEETKFELEIQGIEDVLREMWNHTDDEWFLSRLGDVANALDHLRGLYDEAVGDEGEEEDKGADEDADEVGNEEKDEYERKDAGAALIGKEEFMLRYAQLAGLSEQFTALGRKRPESACGTFKAQQVNRVLLPLKEQIKENLDLVSEEGEQSYSDVSLLIRGYMDLCSGFALRHYRLKYDIRGREIPSSEYGYGRR
ncbi:MAG: hypothetical protein IKS55_15130 [Oscillospiraceae bacterium]|nr:hypothetical protein [Oscillospiraceae bacterium]